MNKTTFHVSHMDCAAEEQMIRMKLGEHGAVQSLSFNIPERKLIVIHEGNTDQIAAMVHQLRLGSSLVETTTIEDVHAQGLSGSQASERKLLWTVLLINFGCFVLEIITGFLSGSMGLVADSLDMLADTFVYGLALTAVGSTVIRKKNIAKVAGYFQATLALLGFAEVIRRFIEGGRLPAFETMIIISVIALAGNALSLWLLQKSKSAEPHIKASMIFTSNDVIINLGVIAAGILVYLTGSNKPDLVIGTLVFVIVIRGALRILKLGR